MKNTIAVIVDEHAAAKNQRFLDERKHQDECIGSSSLNISYTFYYSITIYINNLSVIFFLLFGYFITMVKHCIAFGCKNVTEVRKQNAKICHGIHCLYQTRNCCLNGSSIRRENTSVTNNPHVCSQKFEPECFFKL